MNDYSRGKMQERLDRSLHANELRLAGATRADVASQMGVSDAMAKNYLSDGRFFSDPSSNPDRLDAARAARADGMTRSQAANIFERRAIGDASMLDLIGKPWT